MKSNNFIYNLIDKIFSLPKNKIYLILIFLTGFILRLISAINLSTSADPMHFVTHAINFRDAEKLITYDQSSGLWFAITDLFYGLFGITTFSSRIAALIFGSFTIIALYFLCREFFNEKISLIAVFLLAISPFHIKNTVAEMDVMAMFFVIIGLLFFIKGIKNKKLRFYIIAGISMGLAIYTKVYPLLFIPSMIILFAYYQNKKGFKIITKKNTKFILFFLGAIFIFTIPALTHNYLLYQDKGFLDLQFTRTFGLGKDISEQHYGWDHQFNAKNDWEGLFFGNSENSGSAEPALYTALKFILVGNPIIFWLGLAGISLIMLKEKKHREYLKIFLFLIIFAIPFLASIILLPKHFIFLEIFLAPLAALPIAYLGDRSNNVKKTTKIILIILTLISLIWMGLPEKNAGYSYYGKNNLQQIIEFREDKIPENSLIVSDSRIYRGRIHWFSHSRPYLEGAQFLELANQQEQIPGDIVNVEVYFIECVIDDCGWGTIKNQPEFNNSMEELTSFFKNQGNLVKEISEPTRYQSYFPIFGKKKNVINIYKLNLPIKKEIMTFSSQPKNWFLYDIGYIPKHAQFDYFNRASFLDKFIYWMAQKIAHLALILAIISPLYLIYKITKNEKSKHNNTSI